ALVAILQLIEHDSTDDGSGGYHRSCSAAATLSCELNAPGWTTAIRVSGSISISRIFSVERMIPPSTAELPPESPEPAPRATTGIRPEAANRSVGCTSSAEVARTTAIEVPASGSLARSQRQLSLVAGFVITLSSPRASTSS